MSNRGITVRAAHYDDVLGIVTTIERARHVMTRELPEAEYPYAMQYTLDLIAQGLCWVAVVSNDIVGVAMLDQRTWPWNRKETFLENVHFWVEPIHRSGGTAALLLSSMKARAKDLNQPLRVVLSFPDGNEKVKDRWARLQGLEYTGGAFWCK